MTIRNRVLAALLLASSSAGWAQTSPAVDPQAKPISPFLRCDGRTGHVSDAARATRLLAVIATLGVSEVATTKDDTSKRLTGRDGANACDEAIASEGDGSRRTELAMAKVVHMIEADALDEALAAARGLATAAGGYADDWSFQHTQRPRGMLIEANVLMRLKRFDEAERVAIEAVALAPYDVQLLTQARGFLSLTADYGPNKAALYEQAARLLPETLIDRQHAQVASGDYAGAISAGADFDALIDGFVKDAHHELSSGYRALLLALAGKKDESAAIADPLRAGLPTLATSAYGASRSNLIAELSELLSLQGVLQDLNGGNAQAARATFRAHGPWLLVWPEVAAAATERLRKDAPAAELTGTLAETAASLRTQRLTRRLAAMGEKSAIAALYGRAWQSAKLSDFAGPANLVWRTGPNSKLLLKRNAKQERSYDVISLAGRAYGIPANEALLLHAALLAQSRGATGFALAPGRTALDYSPVRFGKSGEPGFPASVTFDAARVIADIAPHIPQPVAK